MGAPTRRGPRLRSHGLSLGRYGTGAENAITDVAGVTVGHVTIWRDEPDPPYGGGVARTGVTAILPGPIGDLVHRPTRGGMAVLNGTGELTGSLEIAELGRFLTPVYLTATMQVGRVLDGAVAVACESNLTVGTDVVVIPVVGECDDSDLNDARTVQVEAADAGRAVAAATGGRVAEGCVGAGTGMIAFDWKAGIGTSSRLVPEAEATVGVLVLANFGSAHDLRIDGVSIHPALPEPVSLRRAPAGSCIVVAATDAPLSSSQLTRVARRCGLGLARTGSVAHHGSGEIFVAFSSDRSPEEDAPRARYEGVPDGLLDGVFAATVEATEEAVLNALWAAVDTVGRGGAECRALPHEPVLDLLRAAGRIS
jgi:D-aminopeptidase